MAQKNSKISTRDIDSLSRNYFCTSKCLLFVQIIQRRPLGDDDIVFSASLRGACLCEKCPVSFHLMPRYTLSDWGRKSLAERISEGMSPQTSLARKKLVGDTWKSTFTKSWITNFLCTEVGLVVSSTILSGWAWGSSQMVHSSCFFGAYLQKDVSKSKN